MQEKSVYDDSYGNKQAAEGAAISSDVAKWESALKELLRSYLVDQRDSKGQILVITILVIGLPT